MREHLSKIETEEEKVGYKNKIIEAVNSKNVEQLISVLQNTNMALTGLEQAHFSSGAGIKSLKEELTKLFQGVEEYGHANAMVYLGDGGFSRLSIDIRKNDDVNNDVIVELTSNSTDKVKKRWKEIQ